MGVTATTQELFMMNAPDYWKFLETTWWILDENFGNTEKAWWVRSCFGE